jgi:5-methylcytosine-specific restriction protein A
MSEQPSTKNPTWSRDELILALDLYVRFKGNPPGKTGPEIVTLSDLLNEMGSQIANRASDFRNANGVYMKVMNFRRFDPVYISQGKTRTTMNSLKPRKDEFSRGYTEAVNAVPN